MADQRRLAVTAVLLVGTFLASLDVTVVGTAMPSIVAELGGLALYGWVFSAYLLTSTTSVPLYGKLADRWGRKPTYLLGVGFFLLGSLACGAATTMPLLIVARAIQGLGAGALIPITVTILGDLYPIELRARVQGIVSLVWGVSSMVGPAVGALILEVSTWPTIFYLNLPVGGLATLGLIVVFKEQVPPRKKAALDVKGALSLSASIVLLLLAIQLVEQEQLLASGALFAVAAGLGVSFWLVERKAEDPVVPPALVAHAAIVRGVIASFFLGGVLFALIAYTPLVIRGVLGESPLMIGAVLVPMSLCWSAGAFLGGRIIMRMGYRPTVRLGVSLVLASAVVIELALYFRLTPALFIAMGTIGTGFGLTVTALNVLVQDLLPWASRGSATALLQFSRTMGGTVLVAALGVGLVTSLTSSLPSSVTAEELSLILAPERWEELAPELLAAAKAALERAIVYTFAAVALLAAGAAVAGLGFPDVRAGEGEGEREKNRASA